MKRIFAIVFTLVLLCYVYTPQYSKAQTREVLGAAIKPVIMPPTAEGPGFIQPDSPFYFLDRLKQRVRILFALTPEAKARVYANIAGERIAQLRVELAKNNTLASDIALEELRDNTRNAADALATAQFLGKDVSSLALSINNSIKMHLQELDVASTQATGETKTGIAWAEESLIDAKYRVENALPKADLENEIKDDTAWKTAKLAESTQSDAQQLQDSLSVLQKQASTAEQNNLQKRETALQVAMNQKNNQTKLLLEQQVADAQKHVIMTTTQQQQTSAQVADIMQQAQLVAKNFTPTVLGTSIQKQ